MRVCECLREWVRGCEGGTWVRVCECSAGYIVSAPLSSSSFPRGACPPPAVTHGTK